MDLSDKTLLLSLSLLQGKYNHTWHSWFLHQDFGEEGTVRLWFCPPGRYMKIRKYIEDGVTSSSSSSSSSSSPLNHHPLTECAGAH